MMNLEFGLFGMHLLDLYHVNLGTGPLGPNFQCQDWSMAQTDGSIWMDLVDQMFLWTSQWNGLVRTFQVDKLWFSIPCLTSAFNWVFLSMLGLFCEAVVRKSPDFLLQAESLACLAPGKTRHGACGSGWQVLKATWMGKGKAWVKSCFFLQRMLWILEFVKRFWVKWVTLTLWNVFEWRALCSCLNWISSGGFASKGTSQNHWYYTDFFVALHPSAAIILLLKPLVIRPDINVPIHCWAPEMRPSLSQGEVEVILNRAGIKDWVEAEGCPTSAYMKRWLFIGWR